MDDHQKDAQLDEILSEIRRKREEEEQQRKVKQGEAEKQQELYSTIPSEPLLEKIPVEVSKEPTLEIEVDVKEQDSTPSAQSEEIVGRSIIAALTAVGSEEDSMGQLNNQALRMSTEEIIDTEEIEIEIEDSQEGNLHKEPEDIHPLFTAVTASFPVIPPEPPEEPVPVTVPEPEYTGLVLSESEEIAKKGVLNIKESADDDEFKTFFSNTVVIDPVPYTQRRPKRQRISDFVEGEDGGPVLEDQVIEKDGSLSEYRSDDETDQVNEFLLKRDRNLLIRTIATGASALILLVIAAVIQFSKTEIDKTVTLAVMNILLIALAIGVNFKAVFKGLARLVTFSANIDSITALAVIASLIEALYVLVTGEVKYAFSSAAAILTLFFTVIGKRISSKRILSGFTSISTDYEKYATLVLDDDAFASRLTRGFDEETARILIKRKTGFTDGFLTHSKSRNTTNDVVMFPSSIMFCVSTVAAIITYLIKKDIGYTLHMFGICASLTAPFSATLANTFPIDRMQKALSRIGCVVPGFSAVDEVLDANCVVLEGREIFPRGNVLLHGIKTFDKERIDKAILYAASILIQSCDTMSHMFLNVIQNKTEMLYEVDNIIFEDGLGFSCWIDQTRLLIGTRELLVSRDIDVPSRDYENRYTKNSTRDAIYLAVSGKLYAMFVVSYTPNAEVMRAMKSFVHEGVNVLIRTRDFNITAEKVSTIYKVPRIMLATVKESDMEDLAKKTAYVNHTKSLFTHIGSLSSYVGGILSCYKLHGILRITTTIELVTMIVGAVLALLMSIFSGIYMNVFYVILFHIPWLLASALIAISKRYSS